MVLSKDGILFPVHDEQDSVVAHLSQNSIWHTSHLVPSVVGNFYLPHAAHLLSSEHPKQSVMSHVTHVYRSKEGTFPFVQEMQSDLVTEGILFPLHEAHLSSSEQP